jgi:hypothetical protein
MYYLFVSNSVYSYAVASLCCTLNVPVSFRLCCIIAKIAALAFPSKRPYTKCVPVFISPRNRVAQIYPWALGSLSVASYDSQGYGGGIISRLRFAMLFIYSVTIKFPN